MATTGWSLNGVDLRTLAVNVRTIDGWDTFPARRGDNVTIPYSHGELSIPQKWFDARDISMSFEVLPYNTSGGQTVTSLEHLQDNVDQLLGLFYKQKDFSTLTRTMPDGSVRTLEVEVLNVVPVIQGQSFLTRTVAAQFRVPNPFWRETPINTVTQAGITGTSQNIAVVTGGNAPIHDMKIRFTATSAVSSPKIEWPSGTTPEYLKYSGTIGAGKWIEFDCGERTVVWDDGSRADSGIDFSYAWWIELPPASSFNMTATCGAASNWDVKLDWYDKWF